MTTTRPTFAPARLLFAACVALLFPFWASAADSLPPKYPFPKPPLEVLADLEKADVGMTGGFTADERKLLTRVWGQKVKTGGGPVALTDAELIDLLLSADGVTDPVARVKFRLQLASLREACGADLAGVENPADRGEKLFRKVLGAMPNGYVEKQTRVSAALDSGEFNCVSVSAVLMLVGAHHGFDFRPMRTTGHAFLEWVPAAGGERVVVEGTNPEGFRYVEKMTALDRWLSRSDLERYAAGWELDGAGLAGTIYFNRGLDAGKAASPDYPAAVGRLLAALALDPGDRDAADAVVNELGGWAVALSVRGSKECEQGLRVIQLARDLAPDGAFLRRCEGVVRVMHLAFGLDSGDDRVVLVRAGGAAKGLPNDYRFDTPAAVYAWFALTLANAGNWEGGLTLFDRGLKAVPAEQRKWLRAQRADYYRRWSASLIEAGDLTASLEVLTEGSKLAPHDPATQAAIRHHSRAAARHPLAQTHLARLRGQFPDAVAGSEVWAVERSGDVLVRAR